MPSQALREAQSASRFTRLCTCAGEARLQGDDVYNHPSGSSIAIPRVVEGQSGEGVMAFQRSIWEWRRPRPLESEVSAGPRPPPAEASIPGDEAARATPTPLTCLMSDG